ncbi:MAG: hypothetical protein IJ697_00840 [Synergistaceae bacterium]|nr:hypothetical protein [Synergistaceae bacterium]
MPMRFFIYAAKLYEKYIAGSDYYQYSSVLQTAPRPKCICFYNGTANQPERKILRLSEAFGGEGDIEVVVTMLNINYGKNKALMEACKPLNEYSWLVDAIRKYQKELGNIEFAVDRAIGEMPEDFLIKRFLLLNKAEVKGMFLTEYDQNKVLEQERRDSIKYGIAKGLERGMKQANERVAVDMLKDNYPLMAITKISQLSEDAIRKIADKIGVTLA